jgi:hypothetical protein
MTTLELREQRQAGVHSSGAGRGRPRSREPRRDPSISKQGNDMHKSGSVAAMAVVFAGAVLASAGAQAQSKPIQGWQPAQHEEPDPAKRVPQAPQQASSDRQAQPSAQPAVVQAQPYTAEQAAPARYEEGRGGFFLGAQGGKGWVVEDVDQSALAVNAGYRWQAGSVSLIGIEAATGRLDSTKDDDARYSKVEYDSIGVNARFNFGRNNPVYGLVRAGYWAADADDADIDGGYFGLGLGVDVNRYFNLSLVYTNYVYFNDWEGDGLQYDDVHSADTLMLGAEVRF